MSNPANHRDFRITNRFRLPLGNNMFKFKCYHGDWTDLRKYSPREVDFHFGDGMNVAYWELMDEVKNQVLDALKLAQDDGAPYVLFRHGSSTSHMGKTTARSVVRGIMRDKEATPFIDRRKCYRHETVFLACIRPAKSS